MTKKKTKKLIYFEWCDAVSRDGWISKENALIWSKNTEWVVQQIGWILEENKEYITIFSQYDPPSKNTTDHENFGHLQKIPKTWVRKRVDLTRHIK